MEPWSIHGVLNKENFGKNIEENIFQKLVQGHYLYLVYCKQDNQCIFFFEKRYFQRLSKICQKSNFLFIFESSLLFLEL